MFRSIALGLAILTLGSAPSGAQTPAPTYDVVIRNGRVLDSAGNPFIIVDVDIKARWMQGRGKAAERVDVDAHAQTAAANCYWMAPFDDILTDRRA